LGQGRLSPHDIALHIPAAEFTQVWGVNGHICRKVFLLIARQKAVQLQFGIRMKTLASLIIAIVSLLLTTSFKMVGAGEHRPTVQRVVSLKRADKLPTRETGGIPTFHRYWRGTQWYTTSFSMGFC
jgi:hypothetical protein